MCERTLLVLFLLLAPALQAAAGQTGGTKAIPSNRLIDNGEVIAGEIAKITGCAISPLLGLSVLGAYTYYTTPTAERDRVPWHASPKFWAPLLAVLFGIVLKDSSKVALPKILLVPLDAIETLLEKNTSAVLALIVLLTSLTGRGLDQLQLVDRILTIPSPTSASAAATSHQAAAAAGMLEPLLASLTVVVVFTVVWIVSQSINFLILLCPFSAIDLLLTLLKNSILGILLAAYLIHPYLGLLAALIIILISCFLASRSWRFVIFGTLISLDILLKKRRRPPSDVDRLKVFAGAGLPGAPALSYGSIRRIGEKLKFTYRPLLILPARSIDAPEPSGAYLLGKGLLSPLIIHRGDSPGRHGALCRLRPLYNSSEDRVARALGLAGVRDIALTGTLREGWNWLKELLNLKSTQYGDP